MTPASSRLAVIPSRGGSKRIPRKNVRPLGGRPLIAYTIEAALQSDLFSRVVVSTDDSETAEIAVAHGAEVPFMRSETLADDHTPVSLATLDALERLDAAGDVVHVAQLMPNCPLRTAQDICESYGHFTASGGEAQLSVTRYGWLNPWWALTLGASQVMTPLFGAQLKQRSQDLPTLYCPTGAVWWITSEALRRERTFHIEGRTGWPLPWQRALDIDDMDDWALAELLERQS